MRSFQSELNVKYVDGILLSLAALLPLMYQDGEKPVFPDLREEEIVRTKEFSLIRKYFPDLDRQEQLYLCLHLLGSRVATQTEEMFDKGSDRTAYEITKSLIAEFEKRFACVIFDLPGRAGTGAVPAHQDIAVPVSVRDPDRQSHQRGCDP